MSISVSVVTTPDPDVRELFEEALVDLRRHRGGVQLVRDAQVTSGATNDQTLFEKLISSGAFVGVYESERIMGFAALRLSDPVGIMGIFVRNGERRSKLGLKLIQNLMELERPPVDAWALPGDRATKSLYESAGWKTRRLTMSAE